MVEHQTLSSRTSIDGMLAAKVLEGEITPGQLLEFMVAWTTAIAHINKFGFVHGDITTNNVFVDYSSGQPQPLVFDYDILSKIDAKHDSGFGDPAKDVKDLSERLMYLTTLSVGGRATRSLTGEWTDGLYNQISFGLEGKLSIERLGDRLEKLIKHSNKWTPTPVDRSILSQVGV